MAAAVMTRQSSSKSTQHKTRKTIPPRLQLSNGAASRDSLHSLSSGSSITLSCDEDHSTLTGGGGESGQQRVEKGGMGIGKGGKERGAVELGERAGGGRERSLRLVLNGVLVDSQLSPKTEESITQVFSFDTKATDFEESVSQVWPLRCSFIVRELIETERTYVQALGEIIKGYITPLYGYLLSSGDGPNFIQTVFSNIVKIHRHHLDLLDSFQSLCSRPKQLIKLFLDRDFGLYTDYCTNYSKSNDYLEQSLASNTDLQTFIQECQSKLDHSLPLHSHLIKPVQRILKYPLLLEELAKNFDDTHPAYTVVEEACKKMTKVAAHINSSFQKPSKKHRLTPSAIAKIRSKEVEGLQRRRTMTSTSPKSPTSKSLTLGGRSKRSASVDRGHSATVDRAGHRNRRKRRSQKGRGRRHMSVEDVYPYDHATTSSSEEDHLARVSELLHFFENLNKVDSAAVAKSPVVEVAPLEPRQWSMFEDPSVLEESKKKKKKNVCDETLGRTHTEWPPLRKTGRRLASPQHSPPQTTAAKGMGNEHSKSKGSRKKQHS